MRLVLWVFQPNLSLPSPRKLSCIENSFQIWYNIEFFIKSKPTILLNPSIAQAWYFWWIISVLGDRHVTNSDHFHGAILLEKSSEGNSTISVLCPSSYQVGSDAHFKSQLRHHLHEPQSCSLLEQMVFLSARTFPGKARFQIWEAVMLISSYWLTWPWIQQME